MEAEDSLLWYGGTDTVYIFDLYSARERFDLIQSIRLGIPKATVAELVNSY